MEEQEQMELIGVDDAQRAAERFILGRNPKAKINFSKAMLRQIGTEAVYEVEGDFTVGGGLFSSGSKRLVNIKIQVHAYTAKIVGYEM
ncbi:MAG TPA: hypothetical protein G4O09_01855 [Dehalococcoidia bacterium]|nr:hypothetical protein [Dehalococcoidia bacterium]